MDGNLIFYPYLVATVAQPIAVECGDSGVNNVWVIK
jgi:hypothetical protein